MVTTSYDESRLIMLFLSEVNAKLEKKKKRKPHDATVTLPRADLSAEIFAGVAKDECLESYRDVKDERLRYHGGPFFRADRLQQIHETCIYIAYIGSVTTRGSKIFLHVKRVRDCLQLRITFPCKEGDVKLTRDTVTH